MKSLRATTGWAAALLLGAGACGTSSTDSGFLLEGIWQTDSGDTETTLELASDGTYTLVDADPVLQECTAESGTWLIDSGALIITTTLRDGQPVNQVQQIPFVLSGETLRLTIATGIRVLRRVAQMVDCASYGWP